VSYIRKGLKPKDDVLVILNLTPVVRNDWEVYVQGKSAWKEVFNSDRKEYWGTGDVFNPSIPSKLHDKASKTYQLKVHLPALSAVVLR